MPDEVDFATKPVLAQQMLAQALAVGVPARWVTADSVYGGHYPLKNWLESVPIGYALALSPKDTVLDTDGMPQQVSTYLAPLPSEGWQRLRARQQRGTLV